MVENFLDFLRLPGLRIIVTGCITMTMQPTTPSPLPRATSPAAALAFAIRTGSRLTTVGASTRRLSKLSAEKALRVQALSAELLAMLDEEGSR